MPQNPVKGLLHRLRSTVVFPLILTLGCAGTPTYAPHPLVEQILKPRTGYPGHLTNRSCAEYKAGKCIKETIQTYSLENAEFRQAANKFNFLCSIGGRRFKICLDKPGFCRFTYKESCFLGMFCKRGEKLEEYLPGEQFRFLLDADTRCANKEIYDLWAKP